MKLLSCIVCGFKYCRPDEENDWRWNNCPICFSSMAIIENDVSENIAQIINQQTITYQNQLDKKND